MGDVGGFGEFVYVMLFLLMYGYANRMFIAAVIGDMFFVRLETGNVKIPELISRLKSHNQQKMMQLQKA